MCGLVVDDAGTSQHAPHHHETGVRDIIIPQIHSCSSTSRLPGRKQPGKMDACVGGGAEVGLWRVGKEGTSEVSKEGIASQTRPEGRVGAGQTPSRDGGDILSKLHSKGVALIPLKGDLFGATF